MNKAERVDVSQLIADCRAGRVDSPVADRLERLIQAAERGTSSTRVGLVSAEAKPGAWFIYSWDWHAYPIALSADELEARRHADKLGYGEVVFWPFGAEAQEVLP